MDLRLALMCGTDYPVPECQLIVHQPVIKEIALIGEEDFFSGIQYLCLNKNMLSQDESVLRDTNNFQIFMTIMSEKEAADKKFAVQQVCTILFPNYKVSFGPRSIYFTGQGSSAMVDENNFDFLQNAIREICCLNSNLSSQQSFNPANSKAQEIAKKLMRGRERVAAQTGEKNTSAFSRYLSILTVGLNSMSLDKAMELTVYQLYDLVERYKLYINWDIDIRSRLAGAKADHPIDDWMKNIH